MPIDRQTAIRLSQPPDGVDRALWLYELCRFLCQKANSIIIALFADDPPCSAQTCNEMRASEWQYLCAVHDPPKPCCAIDYCCHTLDWAANILTSPKQFPSRLALGTEANTAHQQLRQLTNIFRRVYRIFAHAWFQHREMFWKVEGQTGLYVFFKTVCDVYGLIPEENYTVPPEAEGIESPPKEVQEPIREPVRRPTVLRKSDAEPHSAVQADDGGLAEGVASAGLAASNTILRHRHALSTDAASITTVIEETEETEEEEKMPEFTAEDTSTLETPIAHQKPDETDFDLSPHKIEDAAEEQNPQPEPEPEPQSESESQPQPQLQAESEELPAEPSLPPNETEEHEQHTAEDLEETTEPHAEPEAVAAPHDTTEQDSEDSSSGGRHTPPESEPEEDADASPDHPKAIEEPVAEAETSKDE